MSVHEPNLVFMMSHTHSGDIDSSDQLAGGSVTEKFNLEISRVLPSDANKQHELKQVHCVILRYITQLKKIYHLYR